ncbi:MAG: CPBP family intramembrane glutamic endopeptidase, partial [Promethearchaeia archaeon]
MGKPKGTIYYFDKLEIEGDDLGIFFYLLGFATIGVLFSFTQNNVLKNLINFYIYYDILAICYIMLHFFYVHKFYFRNDLQYISGLQIEPHEKYSFLNFKKLDIAEISYGLGASIIFLLLLIVIDRVLNASYSTIQTQGSLFNINEFTPGTYIILMLGRLVITEELVYRGLILTIVFLLFSKIFRIPEKISMVFAIMVQAVMFGLIHYFRYQDDPHFTVIIIYLICLGLFCGILKAKYGLWSAILLHSLNNLLAVFGAMWSI